MAFSFFSFKKKSVVEDVEPKSAEPEQLAEIVKQQVKTPLVVKQEAPQAPASIDKELVQQESALVSQMSTLKVTREDVIAFYKIFLGRLPESMEVVDPRVGASGFALLADFLASNEFLDDPQKSQLVLLVAKKIVDARKESMQAPTNTFPAAN
jgi:hypothetical protein